ncbi:polynucleotide adenylyltransferase [Exophiala xenobiotica]|nr:polynucleotide adenylyltransferase [Exophiala xenobiotica]KAK5284979.1 polynucleotide adenylyltransferase [Exophiala xenobiotica]KAK5463815.1 hypothetical protein LTR55_011789 [Exophiala xenobiotica]
MTIAGIPNPLMALGHLSMAWTGDGTERQLVKVQECALTPCVQEYEARVTNNTLFLDVLSTTYGYMLGPDDNSMGGWYAVANGTTFSISDEGSTLSNIAIWANAFLTGSISQYSDITCGISNYTEAADFKSDCVVSDYTTISAWNDDLPASSEEMRAIDTLGNFSQVLTNVAGTMTYLNHRFYNSRILGDVLVAESFVNVRWIWLTLPFLLLLMSLFILSVTIYRTKHSKLALWKSSTLPWLYHGPNGMSVRSELAASLNTVSSMEMDAEHILVRLAESEGAGWKFIQMDDVMFHGSECLQQDQARADLVKGSPVGRLDVCGENREVSKQESQKFQDIDTKVNDSKDDLPADAEAAEKAGTWRANGEGETLEPGAICSLKASH